MIKLLGFSEHDELAPVLRRIDVRPVEVLPRISIVHNAFALPGLDALYDETGTRIELTKRSIVPADFAPAQATQARVEKSYGRFCPPTIQLPLHFDTVRRSTMFIGHSWDHYGHFVTDVMSRLWAIDFNAQSDLPLFFVNRTTSSFFKSNFSSTVVDALRIRDSLFSIDRPTRFNQIYVPEPSIQHAFRVYHAHQQPHITVANRLGVSKSRRFRDRKFYLTRSGLSKNLRHSEQEPQLEEKLIKMGFSVLHPERLSLIDQIDMFNNASLIAGMSGSAFHTSLFSLPNRAPRMVQLCWNKVNQRYIMIDQIKATCSIYAKVGFIDGISDRLRIEKINLDIEDSLIAIESATA